MIDAFLRGDYSAIPTNLSAVGLGVLLAFLSGQVIAWVYMLTHSGLSYSRAFVVSLVVMPVIVALVMIVLANNLVTAFGLMAVFAIVRFRNILRDTLDTAYVLAVIVLGMACGMQKFTTAVIGCLVIGAILGYVWLTAFGSRHRYDLLLHLRWTRPNADVGELRALLDRHSRKVVCANERIAPGAVGTDYSYRLLLRDPSRATELVHEVGALTGVAGVTSATAGDESEV
jgi:hypothetical protein